MKRLSVITLLLITQISCSQTAGNSDTTITIEISPEIQAYYSEHLGNDLPSISKGTVSNGELINGKLIPFKGTNYEYFSEESYLAGRAFLNDKVLNTLLASYTNLESTLPNKLFYVMECANAHGGKLAPHRTHQNGTSVDFMMPLLKDGKPYSDLDTLGVNHYLLGFDNDGTYLDDESISIDYNLVAQHILVLQAEAELNGLKIKKVIINTNLKDELFATPSGKKLKSNGIYVVQKLSTLINSLHDDHYHIDFEVL
jgi:penicillin-insensitive murein endopeptidase